MINTKQETKIGSIKEVFGGENIQSESRVLNYKIHLYFHEYKLAIEVDEFGQSYRNAGFEKERPTEIGKSLGLHLLKLTLMKKALIKEKL